MTDPYVFVLVGFGALVLLTAWLPMVLTEAPLSLPIVCVTFGGVIFMPQLNIAAVPAVDLKIVERFTELVILISLMGAALKIDRKIGWQSWLTTWRLLGIAMPLTILLLVCLGQLLLGFGVATALLLAAALAPTDPVLASDVQVGPPKSGEEDDVRFALTSEAGLNDGLAFPFVMCAIAISLANGLEWGWLLRWVAVDVVFRLVAGICVGVLLGYVLGLLVFRLPNRSKLSRTGDGFVALGITVVVYAIAEIVHGYGFVAVFFAGVALRAAERNHKYHQTLHDFSEQLERLLMTVALVLFGGAITSGGLLNSLTWSSVAYALLAIFIVRPMCGWISLAGLACPPTERAVISFFGIRGLGTIYYLAYAIQAQNFERPDMVWSTAALTIIISIVLHGVTVTPVMRLIDRRQRSGIAAKESKKLSEQ